MSAAELTMAILASDAKRVATKALRNAAKEQLEICARSFLDGDDDIAEAAAMRFLTALKSVRENS
jgi:cellobiose-specific phosphotransferase system component IIA